MEQRNLIYGKHAVEEFIKKHPNMIKKIWVKNFELLDKYKVINELAIEVIKSTDEKMEKLFLDYVNHQGIVAEVKEFNYTPFKDLIENLQTKNSALILMLDQIHDPHNFGAIIRSASLLGVDGIVILDRKQVLVNATVVKTSVGTVYDLIISKVSNLSNAIKELQEAGFWVYSSNLNKDAVDMRKVDFANKTVLIVGNEQKGVSELITKNSDMNVYIPSTQNIDSFNVSVASALLLFEVANKIKKF
ncbi:23S rRNA (guanosine2251-2'-O)-methyltransferase [Williamsoniiplasma somnilux]|uniref:23S rRNA (Guanosine2251-2'-O)-methyltransferase n=1 Tax=Williamsoniiplasma somnilux TaxID=215578 RepID=A0A2K8NZ32_9MOLU|nr:23S rRNA (guanosine(2251)-2'-O)-methyltransferase RlmB [Williamsoniiplasma somnilux]ATZ19075.1 23S rRNA (guanosine2251-2'-O)-methyltransferase [Williamsoniiplasma somnilux]